MSKRYFYLFTLATLILTIIWVASNVYHSYATSTIDPVLGTQIEEIAPAFDTAVITELKSREQVQPDTQAAPSVSPTPEEPSPSPTESPAPPVTDETIEQSQEFSEIPNQVSDDTLLEESEGQT